MKYFLVLLSAYIGCEATAQKNQAIFSNQPFEISGKILSYQPDSNNAFISFRTYGVSGRGKDSAVVINRDGSFYAKLFQPFAGDIAFIYYGDFITMYSSPGDRIILTIDEPSWKTNKPRWASIKVSGESAGLTNPILKWQQSRNEWKSSILADWSNKEQPDEIFSSDRKKQLQEELKQLDDFILSEKVPRAFIDWAKNNLLYNAAFDIAFYCFAGKLNKTMHDTTLMQILKGFPLMNQTAIHSSDYYRFLQLLSSDLQIIVNINPAYEDAKRANGKNPVPLYFELIEKYATGISKQLFYYNNYFSTATRFTDAYIDKFLENINDGFLRKEFEKRKADILKPFQSIDVAEKIRGSKADSLTKSRILQLLKEQKDRYVYIDFWGSWCGPCMAEMPHYPALMDSLKNLPLTFVFMAVETKNEKVKEVMDRFHDNVVSINLTDNETRLMNNVFGFSSYPAHFMLGPENKLLDFTLGGIANAVGLTPHAIHKIRQNIK